MNFLAMISRTPTRKFAIRSFFSEIFFKEIKTFTMIEIAVIVSVADFLTVTSTVVYSDHQLLEMSAHQVSAVHLAAA